MIKTLIVSDIHLHPTDPARYRAVSDAIRTCSADKLVLAGDIFEAWIGDDGAEPADFMFLTELKEAFSEIVFIPGNRDFLVSSSFLENFGITYATKIESESYVIVHGDEFCTDDSEYQDFRRLVRSDNWQRDFLAKPIAERQLIAKKLRATSKKNQENRVETIDDVSSSAISNFFESSKIPLLIHGHTHRPGLHVTRKQLRVVISDWDLSGVVALVGQKKKHVSVSLLSLTRNKKPELVQRANYDSGIPEWNLNC